MITWTTLGEEKHTQGFRMGGSTTKIQVVFFWFYFTFQDLDHHPFFHHLAKKGSWAPTTKISFAMNTNKKQRGALHQENMAHTGQDKLLSSIQDPSYEFQSGGKSATRVVSRGNWISPLSAQVWRKRPRIWWSNSIFSSFFLLLFYIGLTRFDILWNKHLSELWTGLRGWNPFLALVDLNRRWVKVVAVSSLIIKMVPEKTTGIWIYKWWMFKDKSRYNSHSKVTIVIQIEQNLFHEQSTPSRQWTTVLFPQRSILPQWGHDRFWNTIIL